MVISKNLRKGRLKIFPSPNETGPNGCRRRHEVEGSCQPRLGLALVCLGRLGAESRRRIAMVRLSIGGFLSAGWGISTLPTCVKAEGWRLLGGEHRIHGFPWVQFSARCYAVGMVWRALASRAPSGRQRGRRGWWVAESGGCTTGLFLSSLRLEGGVSRGLGAGVRRGGL